MMQRCLNPAHPHYKHYGGRGITVCERWLTSANFLADMGPKPSPKHTLERKNNDLGYSPENCTWDTTTAQLNNQRRTRKITFNGRTMGLNAWAKEIGMRWSSLDKRLKTMPLARALSPDRVSNHERKNVRMLTANGQTKPLTVWARELGVSHTSLIERLDRGWTVERAVSTRALK